MKELSGDAELGTNGRANEKKKKKRGKVKAQTSVVKIKEARETAQLVK